MSVLGPIQIDAWFGAGTVAALWNKTKQVGGYHYTAWSGEVEGLGFSNNSEASLFSGNLNQNPFDLLLNII